MVVSVPFLVVTFLVYALIPELRNMPGKCLMFYVAGMLVYSITLPVINLSNQTSNCTALGYISYFALMLSFFWVNVMCFDIWLTIRGIRINSEPRMQFFYYICYAIGGPMILLTVVAIVDTTDSEHLKPGIGVNQCFFESMSGISLTL
jgi:G protein-coupled receptor Mth (Methuselah protein)